MNQCIYAYYYLRKDGDAYKLDYLIKDINSKRIFIKAKKKIKNTDYFTANKQSLYYVLRNIAALIELDIIKKFAFVNIVIEDLNIVNKFNYLIKSNQIKEESINLLLSKINTLKISKGTDILKFIYNEKRPNLSLFIKAEKKGKEYKKFIRRVSTLEKSKKIIANSDNIIFFDFEMNCLVDFKSVEIISVGAVKTSIKGEFLDEFYKCVRPSGIKRLTDKCIEITGLNQKEIDTASSFNKVFEEFGKWCGSGNNVFCFWGGNDISVLQNDYVRNGSKADIVRLIISQNVDIQEILCKDILKRDDLLSLKNALVNLNSEFKGAEHHALNDAVNLARVYQKSKIHHNLYF